MSILFFPAHSGRQPLIIHRLYGLLYVSGLKAGRGFTPPGIIHHLDRSRVGFDDLLQIRPGLPSCELVDELAIYIEPNVRNAPYT